MARWGPHPSSLAAPRLPQPPHEHTHSLPSSSMSSTSYLWVNKRKAVDSGRCIVQVREPRGGGGGGQGREVAQEPTSHTVPTGTQGKLLFSHLADG